MCLVILTVTFLTTKLGDTIFLFDSALKGLDTKAMRFGNSFELRYYSRNYTAFRGMSNVE